MLRDVRELLPGYLRYDDRVLGLDGGRAALEWLQKSDLADMDTGTARCNFLAIDLNRNLTGKNEK